MAKKATWQRTGVNNLWRHSNGRYYARFSVGGKEKWQSLKTTLKEVAKGRLAKLLDEARGTSSLASADDAKITFGRLMELRLAEVEGKTRLKPASKRYYAECLEAIKATWEGVEKLQVRAAKPEDFEAWANRAEARYHATRYNNMLATMRAMLERARKMGVIFGDPTKEISRARVEPKEPELPDAETFERWLAEIDKPIGKGGRRSGQAVRFLAYSGLRRRSEAQWVTWGDIDFEGGWLAVKGDPEHGTKNRRPRKVPLNPKLRALLEEMRAERPSEPPESAVVPVFDCSKAMKRAAKALGMKPLTQHDLRHWFTTRCVEAGVDIPTVAGWLGHSDGGALLMKTYNRLREEHSQAAAAKVEI